MPAPFSINRLLTLGCLSLLIITLAGCGGGDGAVSEPTGSTGNNNSEQNTEQAAAQQTAQQDTAPKADEEDQVQEVDPARARELVQQKQGLLVLDIRTPDEYSDGYIAGAKNIDFYGQGFEQKLRDMEKDQPILLHCASGGRSAKARDLMHSMGFNNIYHMGGGMNAWLDANYPVQKPEQDETSN